MNENETSWNQGMPPWGVPANEVDRTISSGHFVIMSKSCIWRHKRANGCTFMKRANGRS